MSALRLLIVSDIHSAPSDDRPNSRCALGREFLGRVLDDAASRGGFDVLVLLGNLVNDGGQPYAEAHLRELREIIRRSAGEAPVLAACGNHDGDAGRFHGLFECQPGMHEIGGYRFALFADAYAEGNVCARGLTGREALRRWAAQAGGPIIALQHNPLHPHIDSTYPYMLTDGPSVLEEYAGAGVLLSLSGHYHAGQGPTVRDGVTYFTAGALAEPPFAYAIVRLDGRRRCRWSASSSGWAMVRDW